MFFALGSAIHNRETNEINDIKYSDKHFNNDDDTETGIDTKYPEAAEMLANNAPSSSTQPKNRTGITNLNI